MEMVAISRGGRAHKAAGLPYLVYLRHPTTGGVFASWGSLGHVTVAEPGALVGFLGPRVYEALHGEPFPAGVQLAENLVERASSTPWWPPRSSPASRTAASTCSTDREAAADRSPRPRPSCPRRDAWESVLLDPAARPAGGRASCCGTPPTT